MKLELPIGTFAAYLFDCDGTVVDSMPLHYIAWKKALGEWKCEFDEKLFYAWGRMPIVSTLNKQRGLAAHRSKTRQIPFAVVSGSALDSVTASLLQLNLLDRFDALVCAGDYKKSKPDPEAFLLAATRLKVAPESCLVFEDTEMGIQAATSAGMASVKVPPPWERTSAN